VIIAFNQIQPQVETGAVQHPQQRGKCRLPTARLIRRQCRLCDPQHIGEPRLGQSEAQPSRSQQRPSNLLIDSIHGHSVSSIPQICKGPAIRHGYQLLGRILNDAVTAGLIARTPCRDVNLAKIRDTEKRFLTPTQITGTIDPRYRALVITAAYTGCRIGEPIALDTDRYQLDKRIVRIERPLAEVRGHLHFWQPKTAAARRAVTLPTWLPDVIDGHLADYPPGPDGLIFTAPEGGPIRRNGFRARVRLPAVAGSVGQPMRFHDLRHSRVALLIAEGAHPAVIASRLGHTIVKTVLDVYGDLYEGRDRAVADTIEPPWDASDVVALWSRRTRDKDQGRQLS